MRITSMRCDNLSFIFEKLNMCCNALKVTHVQSLQYFIRSLTLALCHSMFLSVYRENGRTIFKLINFRTTHTFMQLNKPPSSIQLKISNLPTWIQTDSFNRQNRIGGEIYPSNGPNKIGRVVSMILSKVGVFSSSLRTTTNHPNHPWRNCSVEWI